ncbi:MAG: hypothetical protein ACREO7_02315, partial [Pseudoxanthomonas sp.]
MGYLRRRKRMHLHAKALPKLSVLALCLASASQLSACGGGRGVGEWCKYHGYQTFDRGVLFGNDGQHASGPVNSTRHTAIG